MVEQKYSIVISVYNEELVIQQFYDVLCESTKAEENNFEFLFVNDGSADNTLNILTNIAMSDSRVKVINFSRNFGHESAMLAGIDYSCGEVVICMDSDLQHPPMLIPEMLEKYRQGFDVINMVRLERKDAGLLKKISSKLFYKFINTISPVKLVANASDFFLISKPIIDILKNDFREKTRFLRGLIQIIGYKSTTMEFIAPKRAAGHSKYSLIKLMNLSFSAIVSFSKLPLKLGIYSGIIFGIISIILIIYSIIMWIYKTPVSGYTTLIIFICAFASILLFIIGMIGNYVGYIFDEVKNRPIYIVKNIITNNNENNTEYK